MTYNAAAILIALHDMLEVWDDYTFADVGPHLTCNETEALAHLMRAAGREDRATALINGHATEDDEGDMHYSSDTTVEEADAYLRSVGIDPETIRYRKEEQ